MYKQVKSKSCRVASNNNGEVWKTLLYSRLSHHKGVWEAAVGKYSVCLYVFASMGKYFACSNFRTLWRIKKLANHKNSQFTIQVFTKAPNEAKTFTEVRKLKNEATKARKERQMKCLNPRHNSLKPSYWSMICMYT